MTAAINVFDEMARRIEPSVSERGARFNRRQPKSCVYSALRWDYTQITSMSVKPPLTNELRDAMQRQLDDLAARPEDGCPVTLDEVRSVWDYRPGDGRSFNGYGLAPDIVLATHAAQSGPAIIRLAERWAARPR
jgi:hypothetical protein